QHYAKSKKRVESEFTSAQAQALTRGEQTQQKLKAAHDEKRASLDREYRQNRDRILSEYQETKGKQEADFRESRWTTTTIYEADKRVAKEQMAEAMTSCK